MNGELYQLARLVCYVKDSIRAGEAQDFNLIQYENQITFTSIPKKTFFKTSSEVSYNVKDWCKSLLKHGINNIFLLNYYEKNDIRFEGFANSSIQGIVTMFEDGRKSFWKAQWEFDSTLKEWNIYYSECVWEDGGRGKYVFENCYQDFENILLQIKDFASSIECENFAEIFAGAYGYLTDIDIKDLPEWTNETLPDFKAQELRLFLAASKADVFGCMGSWNDTPPYMAHEKGLDDEYDKLSRELYNLTRKAVMNAVNRY